MTARSGSSARRVLLGGFGGLAVFVVFAAVMAGVASASAQESGDAGDVGIAGCSDGTFLDAEAFPRVEGENNDLIDDCEALIGVRSVWASQSGWVASWGSEGTFDVGRTRGADTTASGTLAMSDWRGVRIADGRVVSLRLTWLDDWYWGTTRLTGPIPEAVCRLTGLKNLNFNTNHLDSLPACLGDLVELEVLDLGYNFMVDDIPASLGNLTKITYFGLHSNRLTGDYP